ncbi:MAG TPA: ChaN family lipoprotein [Candidatus Sulfotelmatobacter sp.]|nr:ChaN family lipoprotein [Candidatus Sulfotelmatobacter sp.]
MASTTNLRSRRSEAQLQALAGVEREIRSQDSHNRRKYLREFNHAFRGYDALLNSEQIQNILKAADIVLVGDYHALPACQRFAASLLEQRAIPGDRRVVLGVETIFARDQHILDEWWRREIEESELRQRIRFDLDWGYDWKPFYELLVAARDHADALYGLDCMPREDLRKIGARDRHAASKIAEIRERHPNAVVFVLFGESHLAPGHLPRALHEQLPDARVLTVLQNVDALYWKAAGERSERVDAVRVKEDVLCVFNATPLEKYESYRLCLDQWSRCDDSPDFAPTIYNLIDTLSGFLEINRYSPHNTTQPKFLVDMLPEVYCRSSDGILGRLLARKGITESDREAMRARVEQRGCAYLPPVNAFYVREFQMMHVAEDVSRFLHQACQGLPRRMNGIDGLTEGSAGVRTTESFFARTIEHALAYFGSRVLYPSRPAFEAKDGVQLSRIACTRAAQAAMRVDADGFEASAQTWGYYLGTLLYEAYLAGKVAKSSLRRLFLAHLDEPGLAPKICATMIAKLRSVARKSWSVS